MNTDHLIINMNGSTKGKSQDGKYKWDVIGLPHVRRLNGFKAGRAVCVEGVVNKHAQGFTINLQSSHASVPRTDVALMFSPSFEDKQITANSFLYDSWGAAVEEKRKFPFKPGKNFIVKIQAENSFYKIFVDGDWLMDYDHRLPLDKTNYIRLDGDASFYNIECPHVLELPMLIDVPQGLRVGSNFQMDAFIWPKANSFDVMFLTGAPDKKNKKDLKASFTLKGLFSYGKTKVEMNSVCDGKAGEEGLVEGDLSLQPAQDVKLRIIAEEKCFKVEMDDYYFAEYDHKLPIQKFTHVVIDGDISLYNAKVNRPSRRKLSTLKKASANMKNEGCCPCCIT